MLNLDKELFKDSTEKKNTKTRHNSANEIKGKQRRNTIKIGDRTEFFNGETLSLKIKNHTK